MEMMAREKWDGQIVYRHVTKKNWQTVYDACAYDACNMDFRLFSLIVSPNGDTVFHLAVALAPKHITLSLLKLSTMNMPMDSVNKEGDTLLHMAASRGDMDIFREVFVYSNNIKKKNVKARTPMFMASLHGKSDAFQALFMHFMNEYIVDPQKLGLLEDCIDGEGDTMLHVAIRNGYMDLAVKIVGGVPELIEIENKKGETPLHILSRRKSYFISTGTEHGEEKVMTSKLVLEQILQHYWTERGQEDWNPWRKIRDVSSGGRKVLPSPIVFAIKNEIPEIVEGIVDFFPGVLEDVSGGKSIIFLAAERRNVRIIQTLIKAVTGTSMLEVEEGADNILHIAAKFYDYEPWRELDVYVQMQMEIKWFDFVKSLVPEQLQYQENAKGKLPSDVFNFTHKGLVKKGAEWIESAATIGSLGSAILIGAVISGFAATPGGTDKKGIPLLRETKSYTTFNACSILAILLGWLCLSIFYNIRFAS